MSTTSIIWILAMALGISGVTVAAASETFAVHFVLCLVLSGFIALMAVRDRRVAVEAGQSEAAVAALTVRFMGLIWAWAAAAIFIAYSSVLAWSAWRGVIVALIVGAALCLFLASVIERDAANGEVDGRIVRLVGFFARAKLALACTAVGCLFAVGRASPAAFGGETKWAAINVMLASALALATLSAFTLSRPTDVAARAAE